MSENIPWKDQYKHPLWQKKRLEALEAAGFECGDCGANEAQLHVHHRRYVKGRLIWEYALDELDVLCASCHEVAHEKKDALIGLIFGPDGWEIGIDRVLGYATAVKSFTGDDEWLILSSAEFCAGVADAYGITENEVVNLAMENMGSVSREMLLAIRNGKKRG